MARKQETTKLPQGHWVQEYDENGDPIIPGVTIIEPFYGADPAPPLKGWEAVRMRPGMYIGDVGVRGLHHMFKEILDNSVDEVLAGHCTEIDVILGEDYTLSVSDNGRGIPVSIIPESGKNAIEHVFTELTFRDDIKIHDDTLPKVCGGLHGVGASAVNALSEWLACEVKRDGKVYWMRFEWGIPVTVLEAIGDTDSKDHGTKVTWLADKTIFKPALDESSKLMYKFEIVANYCREMAYQLPLSRITFHDRLHGNPPEFFHYPNGIADYVRDLNKGRRIFPAEPVAIHGTVGDTQVEVALQYSDAPSETLLSFANTIPTPENGKHVTGFRRALTRSVNRFGNTETAQKHETKCRSLTAIVSVLMLEPKYNPSDRTRLDSPEVEGHVFSAVYSGLRQQWVEHPEQFAGIVECVKAGTGETPDIR